MTVSHSKCKFYNGFFNFFERNDRFHFDLFFLFSFPLDHGAAQYDVVFFHGLEQTDQAVFICFRDFQLAAFVFQVLPMEFQRPGEAGAAHFQGVFFPQPVVGVDKTFQVTAEFLAFFEGHTGVAVGKNAEFLADFHLDLYRKTIGKCLVGAVFLLQEVCDAFGYFHAELVSQNQVRANKRGNQWFPPGYESLISWRKGNADL